MVKKILPISVESLINKVKSYDLRKHKSEEVNNIIKDISERLGHSDVNITLNIYTHLTEVKKKDTSDLFAKYMSV